MTQEPMTAEGRADRAALRAKTDAIVLARAKELLAARDGDLAEVLQEITESKRPSPKGDGFAINRRRLRL